MNAFAPSTIPVGDTAAATGVAGSESGVRLVPFELRLVLELEFDVL